MKEEEDAYRRLAREHARLTTALAVATLGKKRLIPALRPEFRNVEDVVRGLEAAPRDGDGIPEGAGNADARLLDAARKDLAAFLGTLLSSSSAGAGRQACAAAIHAHYRSRGA